jgi:hypothetical protein
VAKKRKGPTSATPRKDTQAWEIKPVSARAQKQWEEVKSQVPELLEKVRERLTTRPLDRSDNPRRTGPLKPPLDVKWIAGTQLPMWQHEVTGGGRVWYCTDKDSHIVWIVKITLSHPKETD